MFSILNILHITNPLHEQCLNGMTYALNSDPRMLNGVTWFRRKLEYHVEPTAPKLYLYKGTHGHPASKLYESIVMHLYFLPHSACKHFAIKLLQHMVLASLNYQHLKLLSHTMYICDRSPVWITMCSQNSTLINTVWQQVTDTKVSFICSTQTHNLWTFYRMRCTFIGAC